MQLFKKPNTFRNTQNLDMVETVDGGLRFEVANKFTFKVWKQSLE